MKVMCNKYVMSFITLGILILMVGCSSAPPREIIPSVIPSTQAESTLESIDELLRQAELAGTSAAAQLRLEAIAELLKEGYPDRARREIQSILDPYQLEAGLQLQFAWLSAKLALANDNSEAALLLLSSPLAETADPDDPFGRDVIMLRANVRSSSGQIFEAISDFVSLTEVWPDSSQTTLFEDLWHALTSLGDQDLDRLAEGADSYELRGWIELARVYQDDQVSIRNQLNSIEQWRRVWARHSAATRLPAPLRALQETWGNRPTHIALILPLQEPTGNAIQEGFLSAYYQALEVSREVPKISVFDSSGIDSIYGIYNQATESGADLIIGPLKKNLVNQIHGLVDLPVPTLALNYADELQQTANLFQFGLAPEDEIIQAIDMAWETGYRNAATIMPDSIDYERLQSFFTESWQSKGGQVVSTARFFGDADYAAIVKRLMAIDSSEARAERLLGLLPRRNMEFTPRRRADIDFIFLIANPRQGRQIKPTLAFYFAEKIPVFSMPSIYDGRLNQQENRDLDGIIFTDAPWMLDPSEELRTEMNSNLRQSQGPLQRLRAMGVDSFRLYPRLNQLATKQISALRGTTGTLTMSKGFRIHRSLERVYFEDGMVIPYQTQGTTTD